MLLSLLRYIKKIFTFRINIKYYKILHSIKEHLLVVILLLSVFVVIVALIATYQQNGSFIGSSSQSKTNTDSSKSNSSSNNQSSNKDSGGQDDCNVVGVAIHGALVTHDQKINPFTSDDNDSTVAWNIVKKLGNFEKDDSVKAIILDIDSGGGEPTAGEEVARAVSNFTKPIVAMVRGNSASAAYWASSAADIIFALQTSMLGSIGVSASYLDNTLKREKEGLAYEKIVAGKYKDMYSREKQLTPDERAIIQAEIESVYDIFTRAVAKNRNLTLAKVLELADERIYLANKAIKLGLADKIGGWKEVKDWLKQKIDGEVKVCMDW